jgi:hypothetical protein
MLAIGAGRQPTSVALGRCSPERLLYFPAVRASGRLCRVALEYAIWSLVLWSQHVWLMMVPTGCPDNVAAMRVGVEEHDSFLREIPCGRFTSGSALGTAREPLSEDADHGADGCVSLNRECPSTKVNSSARVGGPTLPQGSLTLTTGRMDVVGLPSQG